MSNKASLYENHYCNLLDNPMFDIERRTCKNLQRYDEQRYRIFEILNDKMLSFFWRENEVHMGKDKLDFESNSDEHERFILTEVLKKLSMLDSLQGRSPMLTFGQLTTNPELEGAIETWTFFETIHSRSYTYIIREIYPNPTEIFDAVFDTDLLEQHTGTIIREYNALYPKVLQFLSKDSNNPAEIKELRKAVLKALISVNILEGIRFYSGFSSIWALKEFRGIFPGASKILVFIQRDEAMHLALTQTLINTLRKDEKEGFVQTWKEIESDVYDMYFEASEEEFEWIDHIYSKGHPLGISPEMAKSYVKYLTNLRLRAIGLKSIYPGYSKNPMTWVNSYLSKEDTESALQEIENTDYAVGAIDFSMKEVQRGFEMLREVFAVE